MKLAERVLAASPVVLAVNDKRLPIEWGEEMQPQLDSLWLIKKTLPQQGIAVVYGHPGSGKSFLAVDFAMHVALGWDWNGLKVRKGLVVYVAAEGQKGLRNRFVAFRRHHRLEGTLPIAMIPASIDLYDSAADRHALGNAIREAAERYGEPPALIVIDTLSKTLGAGKENTDDLAVYVANCGAIASEFDCCVLPVHHRPKNEESSDMRGHSSLRGGIDTAILVEGSKPKRAKITKQKDDEERELLLFDLHSVELGMDSDGDPVTSCVVEAVGADAVISTNPALRKVASLAPNYRIVWNELGKMIEDEGTIAPSAIPSDRIDRFVGKVGLLDSLADRSVSALGTGSDSKPDSIQKTYIRALRKLQSLGVIGIYESWVWRNA